MKIAAIRVYSILVTLLVIIAILPIGVFLKRYIPWSLGEKSRRKSKPDGEPGMVEIIPN